jgi:uncharacterized membrane protein YphA (DoxX/SURF4 family)
MSPRIKLRHVPGRLVTGAFILNSGLSKRDVNEETAAMLHGMAAGAYPFLKSMPPRQFTTLVAAGEVTLGAALLLPLVPTAVAGAALTAFSAALLGLYLRTPGMREKGSLRPTQQGIGLAKDLWMFGIGLGLVIDGLAEDDDRSEAGR